MERKKKKKRENSYLTKQKSKTRYSKERTTHKKLVSLFSQFLDPRRVDYAGAIFYSMCRLEVQHGDKQFTVADVLHELVIVLENAPDVLSTLPTEMTIRRIFYDFERIGLISSGGTKRFNQRYYSLTVNECKSGLIKQGKSLWSTYKNIHKQVQNDTRNG